MNNKRGHAVAAPAPPAVRTPWIATLILTAVYTVHSIDRYLIAAVIEPIRHEFHLTDTQLGALGGFAHAIAFAVCVLPIGWLLDRVNRVRLLSTMLAIWSTITALGALATGYWHVFMVRMGVGAAESASAPATQSLIASLFPVNERASALGVVFSGLAICTVSLSRSAALCRTSGVGAPSSLWPGFLACFSRPSCGSA